MGSQMNARWDTKNNQICHFYAKSDRIFSRFPGRQVASSTNHLKTSLGLEGSERQGHATQKFPGLGCGDKASIVSFIREYPAYHLQRDRGGGEVQEGLPLHKGGLGLVNSLAWM